MDNLQPLMLNNSNDGGDWREHGVSAKAGLTAARTAQKKALKNCMRITEQIIKKTCGERGNLK